MKTRYHVQYCKPILDGVIHNTAGCVALCRAMSDSTPFRMVVRSDVNRIGREQFPRSADPAVNRNGNCNGNCNGNRIICIYFTLLVLFSVAAAPRHNDMLPAVSIAVDCRGLHSSALLQPTLGSVQHRHLISRLEVSFSREQQDRLA